MATNTTVTRRSLVGAGLAGTAALLASAGTATARATEAEPAWDAECDVLIVGSGYTGLAAALEANAAGADVKIIDKRDSFGGNSIIADGDFAVCGSSAQKAQGVEDSVEDYVNDMLAAGLNLNDVEKCRVIAEKSNETWEWTQNYLGVSFVTLEDGNIELLPYGGHSNYRTMKPVGAGAAYVMALGDKVEEAGMEVETNVMMTALIKNDEGRVIGIEASEGVSDNDPSTGTPIRIKANKAVILATGGFAGDVEWRMQHDPTVDESIDTTNRDGSTSEALQAAMRAGALAVHLDWIQLGPWCSPDETHCGPAWTYIDAGFPYGPCIDPRTCKRITSELQDRKRLCDAIIANGEPLIQIVDERNLPGWAMEYLQPCLDYPCTWKFDNLEDIAAQFNLDFDAMKAEIDRYNGFVENKLDEDFGKKIPEGALPMAEPPFYVTRVWPKAHHTMGGLKTNAANQVLDVALEVIPGLYAAGEAAGGIHGACLINGRIGLYWPLRVLSCCVLVAFALIAVTLLVMLQYIASNEHSVVDASHKTSRHEALEAIAQTHRLTPREVDVASLVLQGHSLKMVAKLLYISDGTVQTHMKNLYRKLGLHSKQELIALVDGASQDGRENDGGATTPLL